MRSTLFASSVALHVVILIWVSSLKGMTWEHYLSLGDGGAYRAVAMVLNGTLRPTDLSLYASRVFLGWPALIAVANHLIPEPFAIMGLTVLVAAIVPVLFFELTRSMTMAWTILFLPPAWLLATLHPIAEPVYLASGVGALLALKHQRWFLAGLLAGYMTTVKPYGIFLVAGCVLGAAFEGRNLSAKRAARLAVGVAILGLGYLAVNVVLYKDPLYQLHVYSSPLSKLNLSADAASKLNDPSGHWGVPFRALIETPRHFPVPLWKLTYIYGHVLLLGLFVLVGVRGYLKGIRAPETTAMAVWLVLNSAAIVCAGPYWGFYSFDRYFVWALPAALALNQHWLEKRPWLLYSLAPLSIAATAFAFLNKGP